MTLKNAKTRYPAEAKWRRLTFAGTIWIYVYLKKSTNSRDSLSSQASGIECVETLPHHTLFDAVKLYYVTRLCKAIFGILLITTIMTTFRSPFDISKCARPNILALEPYRCAREFVCRIRLASLG